MMQKTIFWISLLFFISLGIWGFYENDMPLVAIFWAIFVAIVYRFIKTKKIKTLTIKGFILGILIDFIFLYTLHRLNPEEDIAGIAILSLLLSGLVFAFIGYLIQKIFGKK